MLSDSGGAICRRCRCLEPPLIITVGRHTFHLFDLRGQTNAPLSNRLRDKVLKKLAPRVGVWERDLWDRRAA